MVFWESIKDIHATADIEEIDKYDMYLTSYIESLRSLRSCVAASASDCVPESGAYCAYDLGETLQKAFDRLEKVAKTRNMPAKLREDIERELKDTRSYMYHISDRWDHCNCRRTQSSPPKGFK